MVKKRKMRRKKVRSPAQRAATRKLVASNRRRSKPRRRKAPKRRKSPKTRRKPIKSKPRKKPVVRKGLGKIFSNPTLRKVLMAAGAVSVATSVALLVAPSLAPTIQRPIVKAGLGFLAGDFIGGASQFLLGGGIGGITGGSNGNGNTGGFA